uniref:Uncharacterized protein n=1 Tax=Fagus sylvatica TaxID=28930 RepID=A0A2N9HST7_FAGSY
MPRNCGNDFWLVWDFLGDAERVVELFDVGNEMGCPQKLVVWRVPHCNVVFRGSVCEDV